MSREKSFTEDCIMRLQRVVIRSGIDSNLTVSQPLSLRDWGLAVASRFTTRYG